MKGLGSLGMKKKTDRNWTNFLLSCLTATGEVKLNYHPYNDSFDLYESFLSPPFSSFMNYRNSRFTHDDDDEDGKACSRKMPI